MVSRAVQLRIWWRRAGIGLRLVVFILFSLSMALLVYWQRPTEEAAYQSNNLLVFGLVNLNIAILCVLAFLVGRNIIKLIFDRRRKILGSRLRLRLVVALVGLTLVPTTILFGLASGLLNRAMEGWFSSQVESSYQSALKLARFHYNSAESAARKAADSIDIALQSQQLALEGQESLRIFIEQQRTDLGLYRVQLIRPDRSVLVGVQNAAALLDDFSEPEPDSAAIDKAFLGEVQTLFEEQGANQFIRVYRPLQFDKQPVVLIVSSRIPSGLAQALSVVNDSFKEYQQLKLFKNPLRSGYLLTLAMITGLILFAAIWFGFYIAREISVPIQRLAEGTRAVARGNYDFQIRQSGDDEIGVLVRSFNTMTRDLKNSRQEAESRRTLIETILQNLSPGVVALSRSGELSMINDSAVDLFELESADEILGLSFSKALPADVVQQIKPALDQLYSLELEGEDAPRSIEKELLFISRGREAKVMCTAVKIHDSDGVLTGVLLILDDITELSKAQKMSAWREVARRIAHEIKNPLTPIQLSAQRLQRLFSDNEEFAAACDSAQVIVENVDSIKRLANEFSNFAMMPTAEFTTSSLNTLLSDAVSMFAENNDRINFQFIAENKMPDISMDREQIRRVAINLISNSVTAIEKEYNDGHTYAEPPRVVVKTWYDRRRKLIGFEVADNGPGISDAEKTRIFQPYFTTRKEGSGLGLAIVTTIVSDHQGDIRLYDNLPRGAKFIVELPVSSAQAVTRRRIAAL